VLAALDTAVLAATELIALLDATELEPTTEAEPTDVVELAPPPPATALVTEAEATSPAPVVATLGEPTLAPSAPPHPLPVLVEP
jgi:hypothetical protein